MARMRLGLLACILLGLISLVVGDLYMQNPRGSNDRLNEAGADRQNANRLFNSENNARGGYCWGPPLSFYTGSILSVEWTNQHGCGSDELACNLVIQYMCSDDNGDAAQVIRDGTTTTTIPDDANTYNAKEATGEYTYGLHEPYQYWKDCQSRSRNKGLFTADQNLGNSAVSTRQSNGNTRYGFECTEERDYYPYWHPSPWKDVAVLVDDKKQCKYFQKESQNVRGKNLCEGDTTAQKAANNYQDCLTANGQWVEEPAWGIDEPDCIEAPWNRDNHLGNAVDGNANSYNWTLPTDEPCLGGSCSCVLRLRYNISTSETNNWENFDDSTKNGANSPVKTDPYTMIGDKNVSLAVDTSQYGRTFQDRSHVFKLIPRPSGVGKSTKIYNLNVRGKRGNIVQTYPATEYDFVPKELTTKVGDYVHFQWTGCDTNPTGNAGEGTAGTDRSNIVQIKSYGHQLPLGDNDFSKDITPLFDSAELRQTMAHLGQTNCLNYADLKAKHGNNQNAMDTDPQNCMKLNAASPYFNAGLVKMNHTGNFYYMSSRNNNFSNRTQKSLLVVEPLIPAWGVALIVIGAVGVATAGAAVGSVFYAKKFPHSKVAEYVSKVPGLNRI